jgi:hypothetical protein
MSSQFGRAGDFDDHVTQLEEGKDDLPINSSKGDAVSFEPETAGDPLIEPIFGSRYWSHVIPKDVIEEWEKCMQPQMPMPETQICLPPINPFVPEKFDLKELPQDDDHHPLLFCSLKVCIPLGKKKVRNNVL